MTIQPIDNSPSPQHLLQQFLASLEQAPYRYQLYSLLHQLEHIKRLFETQNQPFPIKIRLGQEASLKFATSSVQSIEHKQGRVYINLNGYGLLGVNAPLPLHFTEYVFERNHQYGDKTWLAFINLLQHRLIEQFYQSWKHAQSVTNLIDPASDDFSRYIASFVGLSLVDLTTPYETVTHYAKLYYAGLYAGDRRSANNLTVILSEYFKTPIQIQQNTGFWQQIDLEERTQLGGKPKFTLGQGLLCGDKLYDLQSKFRIIIGPLDLPAYLAFFKNQKNYQQLQEWIQLYLGYEFIWDYQLILKKDAVPPLKLGSNVQLGLTTWLGNVKQDVADVVIAGR